MSELKEQLIEIVREFREAFQLKQTPEDQLHYKLGLEESDELTQAIIDNDVIEVHDALADRVFIFSGGIIDGCDMHSYLDKTIQWSELFSINILRATQTVFTSNMSKLCMRRDITATADKYAQIGVPVHFVAVDEMDESAGFRVICSESVVGTDEKEYPEGKLLKAVSYKEPDWSYLGGGA